MKKFTPIYALLTAFSIFMSVSCDSDSNESGQEPTYVSASTIVSGFSLAENDSVLPDLNFAYFAIDLANKSIYNPDSLPKGTDITRLIAEIQLPEYSKGEIKISSATTMRDTTYTYDSSSSDSIDFTGKVYLTVTAPDGINSLQYQIRVNVHDVEPDSLYWNQTARRNLPGMTADITSQKTTQQGSTLYCLLKEASGYTLASTGNPNYADWTKATIAFPFTPKIGSFNATSDALYLLADDGTLYTSADGSAWTSTGEKFHSLIGGYGNKLLGITKNGNTYCHAVFDPEQQRTEQTAIDPEFPVEGWSQTCAYGSEWGTSSQILCMGGILQDGSLSGDLWGFDGTSWGKISRKPIPARENATLFRYVHFLGNTFSQKQYPVWIAMGGRNEQGKATKDVYISYDNGVNWKQAVDMMQLPSYISPFAEAQAFVYNQTTTRGTDTGWTSMDPAALPGWWIIDTPATRSSRPATEWETPYVFLFGGVESNGSLSNSIWKGTINRLMFKPII